MKLSIQITATILLTVGFLSPFFVAQSIYMNYIFALIFAGIILSLGLGAHWYVVLKKGGVAVNSEFESNFEKVMRSELFWLQGVRPKMKLNNARQWMGDSSMVLVGKNYATTFIFVIFAFSVGVLYMLGSQVNSTGIFGALLDTSLGKGVAVSFLLYLLVSSASIFVTGLFGRLSAGAPK